MQCVLNDGRFPERFAGLSTTLRISYYLESIGAGQILRGDADAFQQDRSQSALYGLFGFNNAWIEMRCPVSFEITITG
jgi:hypothetical protein